MDLTINNIFDPPFLPEMFENVYEMKKLRALGAFFDVFVRVFNFFANLFCIIDCRIYAENVLRIRNYVDSFRAGVNMLK